MKSKVLCKGLLYHLKWKVDLKKFIDGKIDLNLAEISPEDCMFGKWLRSDQITKYASSREIGQIDKLHTEIHEIAKRAFDLKKLGQNTAAREEFKKMVTTSVKLNSLLIALRISSNN